ncbi:MAG: LysM peptidoglycan-binding domain-containing protein, partial [Bacteroidia bacterium]|nr:LysM peptidoglycan-binding domain-containing protein [Bacteroidia bacterium]
YAHMGDSRLYLFRKGKLQRLTKDHSYVQNLVDQGLLKENDIEKHPRKNEITKALGVREAMEPEICQDPFPLQNGDYILLCSDGLTSMLKDAEIQSVLSEMIPTKSKAVKLIELANEAGGIDNITVQLIHIQQLQTPSSVEPTLSFNLDSVKNWLIQNKLVISAIFVFFLLLVGYCQFSGDAPSDSVLEQPEETYQTKSKPNNIDKEPEPKVNTTSQDDTETKQNIKNEQSDSKSDKYTITYTVKKGETLSKISIRYNVSKAKIKELNNLKSDQVNADQKIKIPIRTIHKVKKDEVLSKICEKYKVKQEKLMEINNFRRNKDNEPVVKEGDRIIIPL